MCGGGGGVCIRCFLALPPGIDGWIFDMGLVSWASSNGLLFAVWPFDSAVERSNVVQLFYCFKNFWLQRRRAMEEHFLKHSVEDWSDSPHSQQTECEGSPQRNEPTTTVHAHQSLITDNYHFDLKRNLGRLDSDGFFGF